jgi:hypothetical protein
MDLIRKVVVFDRTFGAADSFLPTTKARKPTAANTAKYKMSSSIYPHEPTFEQ